MKPAAALMRTLVLVGLCFGGIHGSEDKKQDPCSIMVTYTACSTWCHHAKTIEKDRKQCEIYCKGCYDQLFPQGDSTTPNSKDVQNSSLMPSVAIGQPTVDNQSTSTGRPTPAELPGEIEGKKGDDIVDDVPIDDQRVAGNDTGNSTQGTLQVTGPKKQKDTGLIDIKNPGEEVDPQLKFHKDTERRLGKESTMKKGNRRYGYGEKDKEQHQTKNRSAYLMKTLLPGGGLVLLICGIAALVFCRSVRNKFRSLLRIIKNSCQRRGANPGDNAEVVIMMISVPVHVNDPIYSVLNNGLMLSDPMLAEGAKEEEDSQV